MINGILIAKWGEDMGAKALKIASYNLWTFPNQCWVSKINIAYSVRCSGQLGMEEKEIEMEITREIFSQEIFQVRTEGRVRQIYIQNERLSVERRKGKVLVWKWILWNIIECLFMSGLVMMVLFDEKWNIFVSF